MELDKYSITLTDDFFKTFNSRKDTVTRYIVKHFIENTDYVKYKNCVSTHQYGGQNKIEYKMTQNAFDLLKNSYKLRQIGLANKSITHPVLIYIETAIIGFIFDVFKEYKMIKQYRVGTYYIDLYFSDYNLAIEIDEPHHEATKNYDMQREDYIKKELNCIMYRHKHPEHKLCSLVHYILTIVSQPK